MGWYAAIVLYFLGCSLVLDAFFEDLKADGEVPETWKQKLAVYIVVALWPFIELHHLLFEQGENKHGQ